MTPEERIQELKTLADTPLHARNMAEVVQRLLEVTLYDPTQTKVEPIKAEGVIQTYAFDPTYILRPEARHVLTSLIALLPSQFIRSSEGGGGWSFMNLVATKAQYQWCEHRTAEQLYCLANACTLAGLCLPREMWAIFPGAMPYVWFSLESRES